MLSSGAAWAVMVRNDMAGRASVNILIMMTEYFFASRTSSFSLPFLSGRAMQEILGCAVKKCVNIQYRASNYVCTQLAANWAEKRYKERNSWLLQIKAQGPRVIDRPTVLVTRYLHCNFAMS